MDAKTKAEELIGKYRTYASDPTIEYRERTAIQCAIIAVKEIIIELRLDRQGFADRIHFYENVLTELKQMK